MVKDVRGCGNSREKGSGMRDHDPPPPSRPCKINRRRLWSSLVVSNNMFREPSYDDTVFIRLKLQHTHNLILKLLK